MTIDFTAINPHFRDAAHDAEERRETHFALFGHYPPADPNEKCRHEVHDQIRRTMNGATFDIPFDPEEIVSDDSEVAAMAKNRYDWVYDDTKQFQREVEEEDAWEEHHELSILMPKQVE